MKIEKIETGFLISKYNHADNKTAVKTIEELFEFIHKDFVFKPHGKTAKVTILDEE